MDKLLDMIEERGIAIGEERGKLSTLADLVKEKLLTPEIAAEKANMTVAEFEHEVRLLADPIK